MAVDLWASYTRYLAHVLSLRYMAEGYAGYLAYHLDRPENKLRRAAAWACRYTARKVARYHPRLCLVAPPLFLPDLRGCLCPPRRSSERDLGLRNARASSGPNT